MVYISPAKGYIMKITNNPKMAGPQWIPVLSDFFFLADIG